MGRASANMTLAVQGDDVTNLFLLGLTSQSNSRCRRKPARQHSTLNRKVGTSEAWTAPRNVGGQAFAFCVPALKE